MMLNEESNKQTSTLAAAAAEAAAKKMNIFMEINKINVEMVYVQHQ